MPEKQSEQGEQESRAVLVRSGDYVLTLTPEEANVVLGLSSAGIALIKQDIGRAMSFAAGVANDMPVEAKRSVHEKFAAMHHVVCRACRDGDGEQDA